jgi:prophage maintenance system killer protein
MKEKPKGEIVIYQAKGGKTTLEVKLQQETVWLTQVQISQLFDKDRRTISEHVNNIYKEKELQRDRTIRKFRIVQQEGNRRVERAVPFYNLDVIISVGYRVKSQQGTQFRIWASQVLKDHLIKGYSINEKRLRAQNIRLAELQKTVDLMGRVIRRRELDKTQVAGLLNVITDYSYAMSLLDQYDHQELKIQKTTRRKQFVITYEEARNAIETLDEQSRRKGQPSGLFGKEKDKSFKGSLGAIYQTFDGKEVYPSVEEKAAHLLYFVVKDHSFVDGNKRIGAFLFVWFLDINGILYTRDGKKRIGDNALVALTLVIAESRPKDKDIIIKVIINLINKENV